MDTYHVLMQFDIAADPEAVHRALTKQDGIASWWSSRVSRSGPASAARLEVSPKAYSETGAAQPFFAF